MLASFMLHSVHQLPPPSLDAALMRRHRRRSSAGRRGQQEALVRRPPAAQRPGQTLKQEWPGRGARAFRCSALGHPPPARRSRRPAASPPPSGPPPAAVGGSGERGQARESRAQQQKGCGLEASRHPGDRHTCGGTSRPPSSAALRLAPVSSALQAGGQSAIKSRLLRQALRRSRGGRLTQALQRLWRPPSRRAGGRRCQPCLPACAADGCGSRGRAGGLG